jgi:hypothetical protein
MADAPREDPRREDARRAASALRAALADPSTAGERGIVHLLLARPRRGAWVRTWSNLPGLFLDIGSHTYTYTHVLLPGWQYTPAEMRSEMIDDLEHFAETGEQPKVATR